MRHAVFAATLALGVIQPAFADDLMSLLDQEAPLDVLCRSGNQDACAMRESVLSELHDKGWCYGPPIREDRRKTWKLCSSWSKK